MGRDISAIDPSQNNTARAAYAAITTADPSRALDSKTRRRIATYAREAFGHIAYAPWLETYAALRGRFVEGCLPDNYVRRHLVPYSISTYGDITGPTLLRRTMPAATLPDIAYHIAGQFYGLSMERIRPEELADVIFAEASLVYVKETCGLQGKGVTRLTRESFKLEDLPRRDFVIQSEVQLDPEFAALSAGGTTTLRITTVHPGTEPARAVSAGIRLGRTGDSHIRSASALKVILEIEAEELGPVGCMPDWSATTQHPDSGLRFEGQKVPGVRRAAEEMARLHDQLPHVRYVGWDVGIAPDGTPWVYEMNTGHAGVTFPEAFVGPLFKQFGWHRLHVLDDSDVFR
ncbi:hypothetical protein FHY55_03975 [Oceanicola sp. D3]|uniref:sugar-transfer associated ATP-grasp domain-containing protein n=1 Tax=Oceanicola sp. D3 TaxID=2587163 RepID=UPI00111FFDCC|nr:sugar-transfer associated ATP-grasp domain-containing protein [Oceanicola sp. D3]QDC08453.1 hypothetical protein FHY55_03975 [Oceanicola sp. D3]